ncbi:MAG: dipeptidase [Bacillota bacterium]
MSQGSMELHRSATVVDTHCDTLLSLASGRRQLKERCDQGHIDLPRLKEGGVDVQFFACYIEPQYKPERAVKRVLQMIDVFYREMEANHSDIELARTVGDIERISSLGKVAAVLSIEGGEAIGDDLGILRVLHRLGVRALGLVWNERNSLADGLAERRTRGGLTNLGVQVVQEMNRLGMIVDVSHLTDEGFWDVIEVSRQPIIASHSNARAVCDHPRNLTDDQIVALAKNGGVMGMNFAPAFVRPEAPTIEDLLDHIDHICRLVGPDHVGLGSDFDGISGTPRGLEDVTQLPSLTAGLVRRGYRAADIRKILGDNHLRVMREVFGA